MVKQCCFKGVLESFDQRRPRAGLGFALDSWVIQAASSNAMDPDYEVKIQPIKFGYGSKEVLGC